MKYRKKPIIIEAFCTACDGCEFPDWAEHLIDQGKGCAPIYIETLEGIMKADWGDWIIKGIHGEIYPCKPKIFSETYEAVYE